MFSVNPDFVNSPDDRISAGPRVGFMQSMDTAYNATIAEATNKATDIEEDYNNQNRKLRELGEVNVPNIAFFGDGHINVRDLEAVYSGNDPFYQSQEDFDRGMKRVDEYDNAIAALREKYPDANLRTSRELVTDFQAKARGRVKEDEDQRRTTAGSVGGFAGSLAGSLDPRYNLTNVATLGVGGWGKTVAARVATEAGGQSVIEAVNEFTGGRSTREMRGMDSSISGTLTRIGFAGVGGGLVRAAGEGIGAGFRAGRRWFSDMPGDPAPVPPPEFRPNVDGSTRTVGEQLTPQQQAVIKQAFPDSVDPQLSRTRAGTSRILTDIDDVTAKLNDWAGDEPVNLRPRTDTARFEPVDGVRFADDAQTRAARGQSTVDDLARRADPETFRVYDEQTAKINAYREQLQTSKADESRWADVVQETNSRIEDIDRAVADRRTSAKDRRKLEAERKTIIANRDVEMERLKTTDTPEQADLRERILKADYKIRDMAPQVSRAYARAKGQFSAGTETHDAVRSMLRERRTELTPDEHAAIDTAVRASEVPPAHDPLAVSPVMTRTQPADLQPGKPAVEAAIKVVERDAKLADDSLTAFRDSIDSVLKEDATTVTIGKHEFNLNDRLEIANANGEGSRTVTVREMLEEMREADIDAKAIKTCSI